MNDSNTIIPVSTTAPPPPPIPEPSVAGDGALQLPGLPPVEEFAIVEVMGHRRIVGRVFEVERFGAKMLRIDVPKEGDFAKGYVTQYYGGSAIFCMTPCDAETVRRENGRIWSRPTSGHERHDDDDDGPHF